VCARGTALPVEVSSEASGVPLLVRRLGADEVMLSYEAIAGVGGYHVYEGSLGSWYSHAGFQGNLCGAFSAPAAGRRETALAPNPGDRYFLVSAYTWAEGPSGFATSGEIPPADSTCVP